MNTAMNMESPDRITRVRVRNARCVQDVTLALGSMTVLIGPNGSGKSTLLEAMELLRLMGSWDFERQFFSQHGGLTGNGLLRRAERALSLGVRVEGEGYPLQYDVTLASTPAGYVVRSERLFLGPQTGHTEPLKVIAREPDREPQYFDQAKGHLEPIPGLSAAQLAIYAFGQFPPNHAITRIIDALSRISVHVPFDVHAAWTSSDGSALRQTNVLRPVKRLERFGANLANTYQALRNDFGEEHWRDTLLEVRAGLGPDVDSVATQADPGGGQVALKLRYRDGSEELAHSLSDGTLAYLAFVALLRLGGRPSMGASLLAFDEPEVHLHPELLVRVVGFFEELSETQPVLLTTHSDRLLDVLSDPAEAAVLCELGPDRTTRLRRPNQANLDAWLDKYRGIGELRAEGYEASVFTREPDLE